MKIPVLESPGHDLLINRSTLHGPHQFDIAQFAQIFGHGFTKEIRIQINK